MNKIRKCITVNKDVFMKTKSVGVLLAGLLLGSYSALASEQTDYCLETCSPPDQSLSEAMKQEGIPMPPRSCVFGFGAGGGGYLGSFLTFDKPATVYQWYLKRLKGWYKFVDPKEPSWVFIYKGPEVSPDNIDYDWDNVTKIVAESSEQQYSVCKWPTKIEVSNVPRVE